MKRALPLVAAALLAGCGGYADFTLPPPGPGPAPSAFTWEAQPAPVLAEAGDALNPSVTARPGGGLVNLYSVFRGGVWRTALAASPDGVRWEKAGEVLAPGPAAWEASYIAANGSALWYEGRFWYWYQAGPRGNPRVGLARSPDGRAWTREAAPVLGYGPYMSWDERATADPYVIRAGPNFYMYYLGQDRAGRQRLGVARSADGLHWRRLRANPILAPGGAGEFDENGVGEPAVWRSHGAWWMLFTGRDRAENRRLGLAQSPDGVRWRKLPAVFAGTEPWNARVLCDPTVLVEGGQIRVWFGGGDVASPDENLHGKIGYAVLRPAGGGVTLAK
jgi:predicted GH43/DUF377 family glycosyl hydrolase